MATIQTLHTSGDELVVILRADYDALVEAAEMLADVQAYDTAKHALATGADELIPAIFAERIISGESPARVWREFRGLRAADLAKRAGVSAAYLSQIETGARTPSVKTLGKLAAALGLDLDDLA